MAIFSITRRYIWFLHNTPPLQVVSGTLDALAPPVQNMGINHRGFHVLMAEELLDRLIVVALSRKFVALVMFGFQTYLHHPKILMDSSIPKIVLRNQDDSELDYACQMLQFTVFQNYWRIYLIVLKFHVIK